MVDVVLVCWFVDYSYVLGAWLVGKGWMHMNHKMYKFQMTPKGADLISPQALRAQDYCILPVPNSPFPHIICPADARGTDVKLYSDLHQRL